MIKNKSLVGVLWDALPEEVQILCLICEPTVIRWFEIGLALELRWRFEVEVLSIIPPRNTTYIVRWCLEEDVWEFDRQVYGAGRKTTFLHYSSFDHLAAELEDYIERPIHLSWRPRHPVARCEYDPEGTMYSLRELYDYLERTEQVTVFYLPPHEINT